MQHTTGNDVLKDCVGWGKWALHREGFNPPVGPMQPVTEGEHPMVALDDPILGSKKTY